MRPRSRRLRLGEREILVEGLPGRLWQDLYHLCMTVTWPRLFLGFAACFLLFNLLFAVLYHAVPGSIANLNPPGYLGAFFFSVETLATVGYGDMHPQTVYSHVVASVQIFIGTVYLAILAGIVFARFSRPNARFLFADVAVIRPIDGATTLMFRSANARHNVIVEASARLRMTYDAVTTEGYRLRRILDLKLVREEHPLFMLGWNLMHVIDPSSPLASATPESLAAVNATFSLTLIGTDATTGQVLMGRTEYPSHALRWNHAFRDVLAPDADGTMRYDYARFNEIAPIAMNSDKPFTILFVCLGNICRSPTAEGVLRHLLTAEAPELNVEIDSAGTGDYHSGGPPDRRSQRAAMRRGIDLSGLRARQVTARDFANFDLILAMDRFNLSDLLAMRPATSRAQVRLFLDYAADLDDRDVPDPYDGDPVDFERVLDLTTVASRGLIADLQKRARGAAGGSP